jgi:hypothetical protein
MADWSQRAACVPVSARTLVSLRAVLRPATPRGIPGARLVSPRHQDGQDIGSVQQIQLRPRSPMARIDPTLQAIPLSWVIPTTGMT